MQSSPFCEIQVENHRRMTEVCNSTRQIFTSRSYSIWGLCSSSGPDPCQCSFIKGAAKSQRTSASFAAKCRLVSAVSRDEVKFADSEIVQNLIVTQFISQHPYTSGTCSSGSKLFIHALSDGLSFTDLRRTCLFYLRGVKVKFADSESAYFGGAEGQWATFRARLGYNFPRRPTTWRVQNHFKQSPIVFWVSGIHWQLLVFLPFWAKKRRGSLGHLEH